MFANGPFITDADYDIFEGDHLAIVGETLFDLNHRFGIGQIAINWQEAHPNDPPLHSYTLSNRLANSKKTINRRTGRSIDSLNAELKAALEALGYKSNGKNNQTHIPYPPRLPPPTAPTQVVPPPVNPSAPANPPTNGGPSTTGPTADDGGEDTAADDKDAADSSSPVHQTKTKKRPRELVDFRLDDKVERPRKKRTEAAVNAPSKEPSETGETGDAVKADGGLKAVGAVDGGDDESGGAKDADQGAGEDGGAENGGGDGAQKRKHTYGGAYLRDPEDPQSLVVGAEFNETQRGPSIVRNPRDDINLAPPLPMLTQSQNMELGLQGRLSQKAQARLRKDWAVQVEADRKAAQAAKEGSKGECIA